MSNAEENDRMIEERGEKNHPELWLRFGEALGLTRHQNIETETLHPMDTYREIAKHGTFVQAATAFQCYESQVLDGAK